MTPFATIEAAKQALPDIAAKKKETLFITYRRYGRREDVEYYVCTRGELVGGDETSEFVLFRYRSGSIEQINEIKPLQYEQLD